VITQNVDGLHQAAGSRRVIELHGNLREAVCIECRALAPIAAIAEPLDRNELPCCLACGGRLKPNVTLFEELLPESAYLDAEEECQHADVMLVAGSSLQVTPAAWLPEVARARGARILIANDEPTTLDHLADSVLRGRVGKTLPALLGALTVIRRERETSR